MRITIPFYYCKSRVPLVVFTINDKKRVGLVDTGSEVTMYGYDLEKDAEFHIMNDTKTSFVGVNGDGDEKELWRLTCNLSFKSKDEEKVNVTYDGVLYDMSALSGVFQRKSKLDITISAIFGSDFLKEHNAKIDYKKKTLTIDG